MKTGEFIVVVCCRVAYHDVPSIVLSTLSLFVIGSLYEVNLSVCLIWVEIPFWSNLNVEKSPRMPCQHSLLSVENWAALFLLDESKIIKLHLFSVHRSLQPIDAFHFPACSSPTYLRTLNANDVCFSFCFNARTVFVRIIGKHLQTADLLLFVFGWKKIIYVYPVGAFFVLQLFDVVVAWKVLSKHFIYTARFHPAGL